MEEWPLAMRCFRYQQVLWEHRQCSKAYEDKLQPQMQLKHNLE